MENTLAKQRQSQILIHEQFDHTGYTTNQSLAKMRMTKSETLNPVITHLMGRDSNKFPLTFLTEGQKGGLKKVDIEDIEYKWPVMSRLKKSDSIVSTEYSGDDKPGLGGSTFKVTFKTEFIKQQHNIFSPNGLQARVEGRPVATTKGFEYTLQLIIRSRDEFCALSELRPNTRWAMVGSANVSEAYSSGNESNKQAPAWIKNQIGIIRKSYEFGGNVSNRTVEFQLPTKGGTTKYWMPYEEYQHEMDFKEAAEENLWWSIYNRDNQGNITTIDSETGFPIPMGGGINDQIPNKDTYGRLTIKKLHDTIGDIFYGASDTENMEVVLFTGTGGFREFDDAIKRGEGGGGWRLLEGNVADKFVTGTGRNLAYGAYFNKYQHVDGHVVTLKKLNLLDQGGRADNSPKHPVSGLPLSSYEMYFLDMTNYDGERNIQMVTQTGRSMIRGVEQGMTLVKGNSYGDYKGNGTDMLISTDVDKRAVHFLKTLGVCIRRNTHCFKLSCEFEAA